MVIAIIVPDDSQEAPIVVAPPPVATATTAPPAMIVKVIVIVLHKQIVYTSWVVPAAAGLDTGPNQGNDITTQDHTTTINQTRMQLQFDSFVA